jgi:hypothetical protein
MFLHIEHTLVSITRVLVSSLIKSLVVVELLCRNLPEMAHLSHCDFLSDRCFICTWPRTSYTVISLYKLFPLAVTLLKEPVLSLVESLVTLLIEKGTIEELIIVGIVGSLIVELRICYHRVSAISTTLDLVESIYSVSHFSCTGTSLCICEENVGITEKRNIDLSLRT